MLCSACGKQVDDRSPFCSSCGAPVGRAAPRSNTKLVVIIVVALVAVFALFAIGGIVAAVAVPRFAGAQTRAQEMVAIQNIKLIASAQVQYYSLYGHYARNLSELGPPSSGPPGPLSADLIPADLAAGTRGGYTFILRSSPTGYTLNANPVKYGTTGRRTFFFDESMVIRVNAGPGPATVSSKELYQP